MKFDVLVGEFFLALSHPTYEDNIGLINLDLLGDVLAYRFSADVIDGELTDGGWRCEHFFVTGKRVAESFPEDERTALAGTVVKVEQILRDEWLGPIDNTLDALGTDPRERFDGKVGSCPPGAQYQTVVCGVLLHSETWRLLVSTHPFPFHLDFTTDEKTINEFLALYTITTE